MTGPLVALTAGSTFDESVERDVFDAELEGDVDVRSVDVASVDDVADSLSDADAVIDRLLALEYTADVLEVLTECRILARCGVGVDAIDVEDAAERGIYVTNVPEYCQDEVADHTMALVLALFRDVATYDDALSAGEWDRRLGDGVVHRLRGRRFGLVGFGSIARRVADRARAFGFEVVASDPYVDADVMREAGVEKVTLDRLLESAAVVSLHAPLTDETSGVVDRDALERMREDAFLVNVARGGLVVEDALAVALERGTIAGAGLDVFGSEPADADEGTSFESPLRERPNALLTPHVAWYSREADEERRRKAALDVCRVLDGERPPRAVNDPSDPRSG